MKSPRAEDLLHSVKSKDADVRLSAIRKIKNQVIGNKRRKTTYVKLNIVEHLGDLLAEEEGDKVRAQTAVLLSSLSRLGSSSHTFTDARLCDRLMALLESRDGVIVEAGLRALCTICEVGSPCGCFI